MKLQPSTAPLPPLLAEVRRRDPDVDIVVLPDGDTAPVTESTTHPVDDAQVAAARARVDEVAAELDGLVGCSLPASVLRHGPVRGSVRARTQRTLVRPDGAADLHRLEHALAAQRWQVRRPPGALHRLVARRAGAEVRASWAESTGAFLLEVSSTLLPVGEGRARTLVRP